MSWQYNEALVEGIAVLATKTAAAVTPAAGTSQVVGPFNAANLRRVVFDIMQTTADTSTSYCYVVLQGATTSGATYYNLTGPDSNYPSLITSALSGAIVTSGSTIGTANVNTVGQFGTTTAAIYRFEYKIEAIRTAIDYVNSGLTSGALKVGPWIQLAFNPTGATGSGTFTCSAVAYGVMGYSPAADIVVNQFLGVTAATGALITTVACKNTSQCIDGWRIAKSATAGAVCAFSTDLLPY